MRVSALGWLCLRAAAPAVECARASRAGAARENMLAAPEMSERYGGAEEDDVGMGLVGQGPGGEEMMQDFVSLHMMSILQPFSNSLRELQAQVVDLDGKASSAHERLESQAAQIGRQEEAFKSQEAAGQEVAEQVAKALAELVAMKREKSRLDGNHEMTKAAVAKTKEKLASLTEAVESAKATLEDHSGRIGGAECGLTDMEKRILDYVETRLDKQGRVVKEVNVRQVDVLKTCERSLQTAEAAADAVKRLESLTAEHRTGDTASFGEVSDKLAAVEAKFAELQERVGRHDDGLKGVDRDLQNLRTWTEQLKGVKELEARQAELGSCVQELAKRLSGAEEGLSNLSTESLWSRKDSEMQELQERMGFVVADVKQLLKWRDLQKTQGETLSSAGHRLDSLEAEQRALLAHSEGARAELDDVRGWRDGADRSLQQLASALQAARAELTEAHAEARGASAGVQGVRAEAAKEREAMAKMASRVDMCCKYFNGLGKGLQDTSRQILSGEGGMLPAKQGGPKLPALPSTPRTIRASSPSPRR